MIEASLRIRHVQDPEEWDRLFLLAPMPHMVQSWAYGEAKRMTENFRIMRWVVERDAQPIALCQLLQKRVAGVPLASRINRGPLFLEPAPSIDGMEAVFRLLRRHGHLLARGALMLAPALDANDENARMLRRAGFFPRRASGWSSSRLDLRMDEEALRRQLSTQWRRYLKKAQSRSSECGARIATGSVEWLAQRHEEYQGKKGFRGPSSAMLAALHRNRPQDFMVITSEVDGDPVGAVGIVRFGRAAEYYIGWNSERGKAIHCGTGLMWHAVQRMKQEGATWFDLGGYGGDIRGGFNDFKKGMHGVDYQLAGEWVAF